MHSNIYLFAELSTSVIAGTAISTSINAEPLLTALITFGVSIVSIVGGEIIKWLVAFFQKKTQELKEKDKDEKEK